jgi:hypothetical protein
MSVTHDSVYWGELDVYRELLRKQYGIEIHRENFHRYGVHFPAGIVLAQGALLARIPVSLEDDGSLSSPVLGAMNSVGCWRIAPCRRCGRSPRKCYASWGRFASSGRPACSKSEPASGIAPIDAEMEAASPEILQRLHKLGVDYA